MDKIEVLQQMIDESEKIVFFGGAGVSTESGIPDFRSMQKAAAYLTGQHDFKSFCGNPRFKKSTVRTVDSIQIVQKGPYIIFTYHGDGFLQNMVRILTGTLLEVGFGMRQPENMNDVLDAASRKAAGFMAPACGLCLVKVDYQ